MLCARGKTAPQAFEAAGFSVRAPGWRKNAYRMRDTPAVALRIDELTAVVSEVETKARDRAAEKLAMSKEAMGRELLPLAASNMADYMARDESGQIVFEFDLSRTTYEQMKAVRSIQVETVIRGSGKDQRLVEKVRIQLHEKTPAHLALARLFGWIVDPGREPPPTPYESRLRQMTPAQRAAEGTKLIELARQKLLEDRLQNGEPLEEIEMTPDGEGGFSDAGE